VRIQFNREFSSTRAPSLNELREEGLDTVSMPNERTCREKNCCQNSIRLGAMTNPREKLLDLIKQRVNRPTR